MRSDFSQFLAERGASAARPTENWPTRAESCCVSRIKEGWRRSIFDHRRVLLRHLVHLVTAVLTSSSAGRLLLGAGGDLVDDAVDLGRPGP